MRLAASRRGSWTPSESSLAMTPVPEAFSEAVTVRGSVHLAWPRATASNTESRIGSLMVLAVRTGSGSRIPMATPVSRFLAKRLTVPGKSAMRARRESARDAAKDAERGRRTRRNRASIKGGPEAALRLYRLDLEGAAATASGLHLGIVEL